MKVSVAEHIKDVTDVSITLSNDELTIAVTSLSILD